MLWWKKRKKSDNSKLTNCVVMVHSGTFYLVYIKWFINQTNHRIAWFIGTKTSYFRESVFSFVIQSFSWFYWAKYSDNNYLKFQQKHKLNITWKKFICTLIWISSSRVFWIHCRNDPAGAVEDYYIILANPNVILCSYKY